MTSPENVLLYLSPEHDAQVREIFGQLAAMGFPEQKQTPHISITFAPKLKPQVVQRAAELLPEVIPATLERRGVVVFGRKRKQTVAWLLEGSTRLEEVAREISALNPDGRGARWIPHLTMGLRLPREIVPAYVEALGQVTSSHFYQIHAQRAGYWQPAQQQLHTLADNS
ncbi:2'-5' RNA ligase [Corynebacterium sp. sy017]|uniref:2'-5' RNA ligase family protein n=1 Tax=unclassified Corynebacterium TaxID=2624378 RepID=UPI0011858007|nr:MULTISPECIES: 2'-5' RNA ligase family protein [unclassified Corynebacterium]MBP3088354.1 2'-5' RNA ligase [Corynebacterium sp. sy017]QDZ41804.1 2'-5' RNA ligase [Corynebacterium sp. sy039]TSD91670.1 2'-5' RNA ligase [Corynebacterium sp. SY003]